MGIKSYGLLQVMIRALINSSNITNLWVIHVQNVVEYVHRSGFLETGLHLVC